MHSDMAPWLWFIVAATYALRSLAALGAGKNPTEDVVAMLTALVLMKFYEMDGEDKSSDQPTNVLNTCDNCNYAREVELLDGSRITVCDGQSGEMVQVNANDTCDDCEPVVTE